ncbi:tRNA (adenosine(37)-N6)-dimethylallyltransferase MiaA [Neolewinella sp.]|uniref:tRNA (adenosine(37)-N6)-dimethylallyltransferase MiaA n=1 Tax=Neolewinella sp. TaxID=2993543 RepID=UPI003B5199CF
MKHLIVIGGPTASGKTKLAIQVAQHYGTEIISADSRQFYRELRIGNARPTEAELAAAPHHFIADRSVTEPLSAGRFAEEALSRLKQVFQNKDVAVAVGGSGLYLRALCEGLDEFPPIIPEAQLAVAELEAHQGLAGLQRTLAELDPSYYATVDRQNGRRLQRALRVCLTAGRPYSSFLGQSAPRSFQSHYFMPATERAQLYANINERVRRMLAGGLEQEARALHPLRELTPLQTVGYQEWWPYLAGEAGLEETVALIQRNSRRYAKRQLTWFRDYATVVDVAQIVKFMRNISLTPKV